MLPYHEVRALSSRRHKAAVERLVLYKHRQLDHINRFPPGIREADLPVVYHSPLEGDKRVSRPTAPVTSAGLHIPRLPEVVPV